MENNRSLLAVVPSEGVLSPAIQRAAELARASGATLHLCSFVHDPIADLAAARAGPEAARHVRHDILREHEEKLERLTTSLAGKDHPIECDVIWAPDEAKAILAKCAMVNAHLTLKDGQHESALRRAFYTPLDWKLMRLLPCELMLVRPGPETKPRRIAAAVEVGLESPGVAELNKRIIDTAIQLSNYLDTRLDLVSVVPHFPVLRYRSLPNSEAMFAEENRTHYEAFTELMASHSIPKDRSHRLFGIPADKLNQFVTDNEIDILVLGSIQRTGWEKLLLGSTAETLAQEIDADLMLVRPANLDGTPQKAVHAN